MRFLILSNPTKQEAEQFSRQLTKHLIADGHTVLYEDNSGATAPDAVILSGGDGTVLRHVELLKRLNVPILGINFGNFGFLTSCEPENAYAWIDKIVSGTCRIEERMLFAGEILHGTTRTPFCGLNEVVIHRGLLNRPLKFSLSINENPVSEFPADGIIVATPTGSTAYNLSAGGPVLLPESRNLVITPICPKGLLNSSIVIPDTDCVRITFDPPNEFEEGESPILTADGREKHFLSFRDEIRVCRASETLRICNDEGPAFLRRLQRKIACSV
mgnify:CR=1 FL=1